MVLTKLCWHFVTWKWDYRVGVCLWIWICFSGGNVIWLQGNAFSYTGTCFPMRPASIARKTIQHAPISSSSSLANVLITWPNNFNGSLQNHCREKRERLPPSDREWKEPQLEIKNKKNSKALKEGQKLKGKRHDWLWDKKGLGRRKNYTWVLRNF